MIVLITLTAAGLDTGPFDLYSNLDSYTTPFETGISKAALLGGYTSTLVPDFTDTVRVISMGVCVNSVDISVAYPTTTTTTTAGTTTTTTTASYSSWNVSTLSNPTALTVCGYALDQNLYSAPGPLSGVVTLYTDTGLTTPFVGDTNKYHIQEGATTYTTNIDGTGNLSGLISC